VLRQVQNLKAARIQSKVVPDGTLNIHFSMELHELFSQFFRDAKSLIFVLTRNVSPNIHAGFPGREPFSISAGLNVMSIIAPVHIVRFFDSWVKIMSCGSISQNLPPNDMDILICEEHARGEQ